MDTALIVFEKNPETEQICELVARVLGPSVCVQPQDFGQSFDGHGTVAVVFPQEQGKLPKNIAKFLDDNAALLEEKKVALICISGNKAASSRALRSASRKLSDNVAYSVRVPMVSKRPAIMEEIADKLVTLKRAIEDCSDMPQGELAERIDKIMRSHNTCTLCTGHGGSVRATPIEYIYKDGALYFLSEGGEKFAHLFANSYCCAAVFNAYSGFDSLESVEIEGYALPVEPFGDEYNNIIETRGLSAEKLRGLPVKLNMLKLAPQRIEVLKSDFAKEGFTPKQVIEK